MEKKSTPRGTSSLFAFKKMIHLKRQCKGKGSPLMGLLCPIGQGLVPGIAPRYIHFKLSEKKHSFSEL